MGPKTYHYTLLDSDLDIGTIARRANSDDHQVYVATASSGDPKLTKFHNVSATEFHTLLVNGDMILIPCPGDPWDWREKTIPKDITFDDFCAQDKKSPDRERIGGPDLTPEYLYFNLENKRVRKDFLDEKSSLDERRAADAAPGKLLLEKDDVLLVPYPIRQKLQPKKAAPSDGTTASATVESEPEWVSRLRAWSDKISTTTEQLRKANAQCQKCAEQGQREAYRISALLRLVLIQVKFNSEQSERAGTLRSVAQTDAKLQSLLKKLAALQQMAADDLYANPAAVLFPAADNDRKVYAEKLLSQVRDPDLKKIMTNVLASPKARIQDKQFAADIAQDMLLYAYRQLAESPQAKEALKDIEEGLVKFTKAADSPPAEGAPVVADPSSTTPLSALLSGGVSWLKFGSNLAATCITITMLLKATAAVGNRTKASELGESLALALAIAAKYTKEDAEAFKGELLAVTHAEAATASLKISSQFSKWTPLVAAPIVISGLAFLIQMGEAPTQTQPTPNITPDQAAAMKYVSVFGTSVGTAVGAVQWIAANDPLQAIGAATLKAIGTYGGALVGVAGIFSSMMSFYTAKDGTELVSSGLQLIGGATSLAGTLLLIPGLQVAGTVVLTISVTVSMWPQIKALSYPGAKKVLLRHLNELQVSEVYCKTVGISMSLTPADRLLAPVQHALGRAVKDVITELDSDDGGTYAMNSTPGVLSLLRGAGFRDDDIGAIAERPPPSENTDPHAWGEG